MLRQRLGVEGRVRLRPCDPPASSTALSGRGALRRCARTCDFDVATRPWTADEAASQGLGASVCCRRNAARTPLRLRHRRARQHASGVKEWSELVC